MSMYARTMDQKLRVVVFRLKKKEKKNMAAALDTFCPHLPKSLPAFFRCLFISQAIANEWLSSSKRYQK